MPPKPILRQMAESLYARGWSPRRVADHLGIHEGYAVQIHRRSSNIICLHDNFQPTAEQHKAHVWACLAEGGFPAATTKNGQFAGHIAHDGEPWRHIKRGRGR